MSTSIGSREFAAATGEARPRVSWSALFAGVVIVVAIQVLLTVLGTGVGLSFVNPGHSDSASASSLGTGAGIWWLASSIIALLAGAYSCARLAGVGSRFDGMLHGLVVWGLSLLLTAWLVTTVVGGVVGGAFSALSGTVSTAGSAVGSVASALGSGVRQAAPAAAQATGITPDAIRQQAQDLLQANPNTDPAAMSPADATKAVAEALPDLVAGGAKADAAKQRITAIVAAQAHISQQDAQARVDRVIQTVNTDKQKAVEAAKQAADASAAAASNASYLAFASLLIGALAALAGGALAAPRTALTRYR